MIDNDFRSKVCLSPYHPFPHSRIRAYERLHTELELMSALAEGEESARKCGWVSMDSAMKKLGV